MVVLLSIPFLCISHTDMSDTDCDDGKCRQYVWDQCALDALQHFKKSVFSWSTCMRSLCYAVWSVWDVFSVSLRCSRSLFCVFDILKKFGQCLWDVWEVCSVFLRCRFEMFAQSGNWRPIPIIAKARCRASERLATVVAFQTFYMGESRRLKNETLVP